MHRCIKCGLEFTELTDILKDGCPQCGSKFFSYTRKVETKKTKKGTHESVETIMVKDQGIYEVNLSSLLENDSIIVSDEEGRYLIDINSLLKKGLPKNGGKD